MNFSNDKAIYVQIAERLALDRRPLRNRIQAMKNNAAICRLRRGRPGQGGPW